MHFFYNSIKLRTISVAATITICAHPALAQSTQTATSDRADTINIVDRQAPLGQDATAPAKSMTKSEPRTADTGLTWHGITLYGTLDIGLAYLNHGAKLTSYYGPGLPFVIQKNSGRSIFSVSPNGLSQSKIGLSGIEPINNDLKAVFKLETGFQPTSGHLSDGPRSLIVNNGLALSQQTTSGDSSRAGQVFQGAAYAGLSSKTWGTLLVGRQTSLLLDNFGKYDPQNSSQAFSLIGYSGFAAGAGATETARFDSALKYSLVRGPVRISVMHNFRINEFPGSADQINLGGDYKHLSVDLTYSHVSDAVTESSLSAAQNLAHPGTLAAVVSDNTTYAAEAKYTHGPAQFFGGLERIEFANPAHPLPVGFQGIGGYVLSSVSNTAYATHRVTYVSWFGARYTLTDKLQVTGAYYRYDQNSYKGNGCSDASAASCSGTLQDFSILADYRLTKQFDVYGGVNHSAVADGLASGFLVKSMVAPVVGARFNF